MKNRLISKRSIITLSIGLIAIATFAFVPMAHAYGAGANWQLGFAGTFTLPGSGNNGFWGWCELGQGSGSPATSGTDADCKVSNYCGPNHSFQALEAISGDQWSVGPSLCPPPFPAGTCSPPGVPSDDFFITGGTASLTGPAIATQPPPPGCSLSGQTATCFVPGQTATCSLQTLACSGSFSIPGVTIPCAVDPSGQRVSCITLSCAAFSQGPLQAVGCSVPGQTVTCMPSSGSLNCVTAGITSVTYSCNTSGMSLTCNVPFAVAVCSLSGQTLACPIKDGEEIGFYAPDTGLPAVAGHYNLNGLIPFMGPGAVGELQAQVTQVQ